MMVMLLAIAAGLLPLLRADISGALDPAFASGEQVLTALPPGAEMDLGGATEFTNTPDTFETARAHSAEGMEALDDEIEPPESVTDEGVGKDQMRFQEMNTQMEDINDGPSLPFNFDFNDPSEEKHYLSETYEDAYEATRRRVCHDQESSLRGYFECVYRFKDSNVVPPSIKSVALRAAAANAEVEGGDFRFVSTTNAKKESEKTSSKASDKNAQTSLLRQIATAIAKAPTEKKNLLVRGLLTKKKENLEYSLKQATARVSALSEELRWISGKIDNLSDTSPEAHNAANVTSIRAHH